MGDIRVGFAFCGSFCTYSQAMPALERAKAEFGDVTPIISEASAVTDTRFGKAADFVAEMERICGKKVIDSILKAEPIGPRKLLDVIVVAPCTGNSLAKLANGIADTSVTMACKSHLRNARPVVLAVSTNKGVILSLNRGNSCETRVSGFSHRPFLPAAGQNTKIEEVKGPIQCLRKRTKGTTAKWDKH